MRSPSTASAAARQPRLLARVRRGRRRTQRPQHPRQSGVPAGRSPHRMPGVARRRAQGHDADAVVVADRPRGHDRDDDPGVARDALDERGEAEVAAVGDERRADRGGVLLGEGAQLGARPGRRPPDPVAGEVGGGEAVAAGERAGRVDERGDRVGRDELGAQPGRQRAAEAGDVAEREIDLVALERAEGLDEVAAHADLDRQPGVLGRGRADQPRRGMEVAPDVDAQGLRRRPESVGRGPVGDLEHEPRAREEALPGGGQHDPAAPALEQPSRRRPRAARRAWTAPAG